jgi:hypothetical protein
MARQHFHQMRSPVTILRQASIVVLANLVLAGCDGKQNPSLEPPSSTVTAPPVLDASAILNHKMECKTLGLRAEKEQFPEGMNSVDSLNQGLINFGSEFGYSEALNTCIMLSGTQVTNFKTNSVTSYQATLTDLLSNKTLATYWLIGGRVAPTSISREAFNSKVRELLGDPLPRWLEQGPLQLPTNVSQSHHDSLPEGG